MNRYDFEFDRFLKRYNKKSRCAKAISRAKVIKMNDKIRQNAAWLNQYPNYATTFYANQQS